jgi:single-stranded DNA-binding protein
MNTKITNNTVTLIGDIVSGLDFNHKVLGEGFYMAHLSVKRLSKVVDIIPIMISDRLIDVSKKNYRGNTVKVSGEFRSYNQQEGDKRRLVLFVLVEDIDFVDEFVDRTENNQISLNGFICKTPIHRETPAGIKVTDLLIAVNRPSGKSDYIPCIVWKRNSRYSALFTVGLKVQLSGRIQSRDYNKKMGSREEKRTAYEVSVSRFDM